MAIRPGDVGKACMTEMGIRGGIGVAAVPVDTLVVGVEPVDIAVVSGGGPPVAHRVSKENFTGCAVDVAKLDVFGHAGPAKIGVHAIAAAETPALSVEAGENRAFDDRAELRVEVVAEIGGDEAGLAEIVTPHAETALAVPLRSCAATS